MFGLLTLVTFFVSCTDQEEIEIAYKTSMSITASHIFDSYTTVLGDEFNMKGTNNGDWDINIHAFIYDNNGNLIKKAEEQYPNLNSILNVD